MLESKVESAFREETKRRGGVALKFVSPGMNGVPDRIVLFPGGRMAFVELKAPGQKPRTLQLKRKRQLERLGFSVYVIDTQYRAGTTAESLCSLWRIYNWIYVCFRANMYLPKGKDNIRRYKP